MQLPSNISVAGQEMISRFFTTAWVYEQMFNPAEWLLVFQTDSVICANSPLTVDNYLQYDWIGSPWDPVGRWGGNGGLSLRRVSRILQVLRHQERADNSEPEDVWLAERIAHLPDSEVANGSVSLTFSGESNAGKPVGIDDFSSSGKGNSAVKYEVGIDDWRIGFYEPMGYHTGGSGEWLFSGVWGQPELRNHIYDYCPEVKMILNMDLAKHLSGNCGSQWR